MHTITASNNPTKISLQDAHIVVVDDEAIQRKLLRHHLQTVGYQISEAANAGELQSILDTHRQVDLLLLDVMMPGKDGLSLTREIRTQRDLGIILVTRKNTQQDRILGLELGADDYIHKPFDPDELLARVHSVLRRVRGMQQPPRSRAVQFDGYQFEPDKHRLSAPGGEPFKLSRGESHLLDEFLQHPGQLLSRAQLARILNPEGENPGDDSRSVDVLIGRLRRKLGDDPRNPRFIITVHGKGYVFNRTP